MMPSAMIPAPISTTTIPPFVTTKRPSPHKAMNAPKSIARIAPTLDGCSVPAPTDVMPLIAYVCDPDTNLLVEIKMPASFSRHCSAGGVASCATSCGAPTWVPQPGQKDCPDTLVPQLPQNAIIFSARLCG